MAKVVFVSQPRDAVAATDAQAGSVAIVLWELAKRVARYHEVVILAPAGPGQAGEETSASGVRLRRIPLVFRSLHKAFDLASSALQLRTPYFASRAFFREYAFGVAHWLERERPDIVHLQNSSQFLPIFRAAVPEARLIQHVHDEFLSLLSHEIVCPRLKHASAIVTCSNFVTQRLQMRMPYAAEKIHTVGNGVDTTYFEATERPADPAQFRILFVGRVSPEKGVHNLAAAFAQLAAADAHLHLDVVGPVGLLPFNQIKLLSADAHVAALKPFYGTGLWSVLDKQVLHAHTSYWQSIQSRLPPAIRPRVTLLGSLSREQLKRVYGRANVLVMPSVCEEPFGLPLAEAMASGLPCVASRTGGMSSIVAHNLTGLLVERDDTTALRNAIGRLVHDPVERERMGLAARRRAVEHCDWAFAAARLEAIYAHCLERPAAAVDCPRQAEIPTPLT